MAKKTTKASKATSRARGTNSQAAGQRINKFLAAAGVGSRRDVEELILQGRVEVGREVVTNLARRVDPQTDQIKVDGALLKKPRLVYYALNKPPGVLSTNRDPSGRMRVIDLVPSDARVFSVGRLDKSSEGLVLLTNDGDLAQRLAHPKFGIQKGYFVVVAGLMTSEELAKLHKGVHLAEGFAKIDGAVIRKHRKGCTEIEITLSEGKNREIRRILARAGHKVVLLRRIAIGSLRLGQLPIGAARELSPVEVKALYASSAPPKRAKKKTTTKGSQATSLRQADELGGLSTVLDDDDDFQSFDDDFVGGFEGSPHAGAVLTMDDDPPDGASGPGRKRRTAKSAHGRDSSSRRDSSNRRGGKQASARSNSGQARPDARSKGSTSAQGKRTRKSASSTQSSSGRTGKKQFATPKKAPTRGATSGKPKGRRSR
ncbi:MAG: rRNA pseudouridine synthase [Planctomycetales bacterium]|nr:rRNA pseudouridine synthase [Planctomycetales bacterium]